MEMEIAQLIIPLLGNGELPLSELALVFLF